MNIMVEVARPWTWSDLPIHSRAHSATGGWWVKTMHGWKWPGGDTFPTPGADVIRVEVPLPREGESQ